MAESKTSYDGGSPAKGVASAAAEDKWDEKNDDYDDAKESASCHAPSDSKMDEKVEEPLSDAEILESLQKYFFEDQSFGKTLEAFVDQHNDIVDLDSDEYKLTYTTVYEEYKQLFEQLLESFIARELHVSLQQVYRALQTSSADENPLSLDSFFAQILVASTDFEVFFGMLRDSARSKRSSHGHK